MWAAERVEQSQPLLWCSTVRYTMTKGSSTMDFANLARTFEELERTSSRLTLIELVTRLFRSIEQPQEIQQVCYLMQGRVAPFYEALEMGMADKSVMKSIALASHTTPEQIAAQYETLG